MKQKVITILAALVLLVVLSVTEQMLVFHLTNDALARTAVILDTIRQNELEDALQKARELDLHWDDHAGELEVLVDHSSTDEVRYGLSRLIAALEAKDRAAALIYASEVEGGVEHVRERQEFSIQNLL